MCCKSIITSGLSCTEPLRWYFYTLFSRNLIHNYVIFIRFYKIFIRFYEILIRFYETLFRNYEILFRNYEILIRFVRNIKSFSHCLLPRIFFETDVFGFSLKYNDITIKSRRMRFTFSFSCFYAIRFCIVTYWKLTVIFTVHFALKC
jgi:hypothetical protein